MSDLPELLPDVQARLSPALRLAEQDRWSEALALAAQVFPEIEPDALGYLLVTRSADPAGAAARALDFARSPAVSSSASDARFRAALFLAQERALDAIGSAREAIAREPDDRDGLHLLFSSAFPIGAIPEARQAAERLVEVAPLWPASHDALAAIRQYEERYADARAAAERSATLDPNRLAAWQRLGSICYAQRDWRRAVGCFWLVAQVAPGSEETRQHLVESLAQFEAQSVRRHLPLGIAAILAASVGVAAGSRALFLRLGFPGNAAFWLAIPPVLLLLPAALSLLRRFCLRDLDPGVRDFADGQRRQLGQRTGSARLAGQIARIALFVSYYVAVSVWEYKNAGDSFIAIVVFYVLIAAMGWLRHRFTKPDTYFSLRER